VQSFTAHLRGVPFSSARFRQPGADGAGPRRAWFHSRVVRGRAIVSQGERGSEATRFGAVAVSKRRDAGCSAEATRPILATVGARRPSGRGRGCACASVSRR